MRDSSREALPDQDPLAGLAGIDVRIGRASTNNNDGLYRRLLLKFHNTQGAAFETAFDAAMRAGDERAAIRLAHDMRAVSGSLGMKELEQAAQKLESELSNGASREAVAPVLAGVVNALAPVQKSLASLAA